MNIKAILAVFAIGAVTLASTTRNVAAADMSYAGQIETKPVFSSPILWVGEQEPDAAESAALLDAIHVFETNGVEGGVAALEEFLTAHPQSAWAPSLNVSLAEDYRRHGRYTLALSHWESAWEATKACQDANGQKIAARTLAGWTRLLASLGEKEKLSALFQEADGLHLPLGIYDTKVEETKGGLAVMDDKPGVSYRCGSYALGRVAMALGLDAKISRKLFDTDSPDGGFNMAELLALARTNGIDVAAVRRPADAGIVVPSVVHWKLNHYAAITEKKGNLYRVEDPTFEGHVWVDEKTIDAESSGEFILPRSQVPTAWQKLTQDECAGIYGKGYPNCIDDSDDDGPPNGCGGGDGNDDNEDSDCDPPASNDGAGAGGGNPPNTPCCGMPQWSVSEPYITLWLRDTPLLYRQSNQKWLSLDLSYKNRAESLDNPVGGFGDKWSCNWLGMLQQPSDSPDMVIDNLAGGGQRSFQTDGTLDYKTARKFAMVTVGVGGGDPPALISPTGSQNVYGYAFGYLDGSTNFFLTERIDRYGRVLQQFNYQTVGTVVRLTSLVDMDGKTNTLAYGNATYAYLITAVTNAYGAVAYFNYNAGGILTNIVDAQGMSSSFQYDGNENITNLTTLYGTNTFQYYNNTSPTNDSGALERALLVTEASGDHQLFVYRDDASDVPDSIPFPGDAYPSYRMSYHWNRAQYDAVSTTNVWAMTQADYQNAGIKHWLHGDPTSGGMSTVSDTLSATADPYDSIAGVRPNCVTYAYQGETPPSIGTDGALMQVTSVQLNGSPTLSITRNTLGRSTSYAIYNSNGSTAVYTNIFDSSGQILQHELGPRGELTRGYGYDPVYTNLLISVTNAVGDVLHYTHDTNSMRVTSITFPAGMVRTNLYYASGPNEGFLQSQIDIGFRTNSFTYANGNVLAQTNELGLATTDTWDNLNRLVSTAYPDGTTVSNVYSKLDIVAVKDRLNQWTHYGFNAIRQLIAETNVNGQVTLYAYCGCGAPDQITSLNTGTNVVTLFSHDIDGRLTSTLFADGYQVNRGYDTNDFLQAISDNTGRQITLNYARLGQRHELAYAYFASSLSGQQLLLKQQFDEYGRVTNSVDRNGVTVTNNYDFLDRIVARRSIGAAGMTMSGLETFAYDSAGLTNYTDQLGRLTAYARDASGRVLCQTNANQEVQQFAYNPADELMALTDGKMQTTSWNYDQYGQVTNKLDANATPMFAYQYDPDGRLTNRWQAGSIVTTYKYDPIGNLTNIVYPTSSNVVFQYDSLNELTNMVDGVGQTRFTWTLAGQLAGETGPWANDAVAYTYAGQLRSQLSLQQPGISAWVQSYAYDEFARLTNVTSTAGAFSYQYAPTSHGGVSTASDMVQKLILPDGAYDQRAYDDLARLTNTALTAAAGGTVLDQYQYAYDAGSERTQQKFTAGNYQNYTYDNIGQLKTASGFEANGITKRLQEQFGYAYDSAWNLNQRTNNALIQTFSVNNVNELSSETRAGTLTVVGSTTTTASSATVNTSNALLYADNTFASTNQPVANGVNTYTAVAVNSVGYHSTNSVTVNLPTTVNYQYDGRGNLTNDGARSFAYDNENELTSVWLTNAWRNDFAYDGLNRRRIEKDYNWSGSAWAQTNETHYVYDGNLVIQERSSNNVPLVTYTRGSDWSGGLQDAGGIGGLLARTDNTLLATNAGAAHAFYHCDADGNVTALFNGAIVASYEYDPYGNMLSINGPLAFANAYRFSSKEWNSNAGLYYYGQRFYDPNLQRWLNRDPIQEWGGYNLYEAMGNNPVTEVDFLGLCGADAAAALSKGESLLAEEEAAGWGAGGNFDPYVDAGLGLTALGLMGYAGYEYLQPAQPTVCEMSHKKPRPSTYDKHTKPRAGGPEKKDPRMQQPPPPRGPKQPNPPKPPQYFKGPKQKNNN